MKKTILFAIDLNTEETLISESEKGSNKVNFIERFRRNTAASNQIQQDIMLILPK